MNIFKEFEDELKPNEKYRVAFVRKAVQDYYLFFFQKCYFPRERIGCSSLRGGGGELGANKKLDI